MKENSLVYNIIYNTFRANSLMIIPELTNSIIAINQGTTVCVVNGVVLNPGTAGTNNGESFVFGGNKGEIFRAG